MKQYSPQEMIRLYHTQPGSFWVKQQQLREMELFRYAANKVPAYKQVLKKAGINPARFVNHAHWSELPTLTKDNYLRYYPLQDLTEPKALSSRMLVMTATSGSTGAPTYVPRDERTDWAFSVLMEFFLDNGPKGSTLVIDGFGMGVWIGGVITYQVFHDIGLRHRPVTIITPGINKEEIFSALKTLAPKFDNVILGAYPPFMKDIVDEAAAHGVNFKKFKTRLFFAAETVSEQLRDYIMKKTRTKNPYLDTYNQYGSAELGNMGFETPTSILIRRLALSHSKLYRSLFDEHRLPTVAQYNPIFFGIREEHGELLMSAAGAVPLVRYKVGDIGSVLTFDQVKDKMRDNGINIEKEAKKVGIRLTRMPFVFVYERVDMSTKLYGANVYAEHVREVLQHPQQSKHLSGKFTMTTKQDKKQNQYLEINIELLKGKKVDQKLTKAIVEKIMQNLLKKNAEYKNNHNFMGEKVKPKVVLWKHGHEKYFDGRGKHTWVINKK